METVYYNFYTFHQAKASGGEDHRALLVRQCAPRRRVAPEGKVISLEDYRVRQAAEENVWAGDGFGAAEDECRETSNGAKKDAPRSHWREALLMGLELATCGAIIAVAVVACAAFLL